MMRGMYSAISGLKSQQTMLDVAANDLANVNTVGFKGGRVTFKDALQQTLKTSSASGAGVGGTNAEQIGLGASVGTIDNNMSAGAVQATGNALDVAIQGDGWFRAGPGNPTPGTPTAGTPPVAQVTYTRAGNFTRNDNGYLVTANGDYVLGRDAPGGANDLFLQIPAGASDVAIAQDGAVSFVPPAGYTQPAGLPAIVNGRAICGYLSLAKFPNDAGLERLTSNRWRASANTGVESVNTPGGGGGTYGTTTAGAIEMSNVDLATEFTMMITAQRGFQANSRVISTADQMLQDLVNLNR
jgi:flagellar hook protein FlgE